ncbi:MAG: ABC transporter permease [Odoribacter sp.]|nr:ABC transporter permease [Odoribacter sp.]
MVIKFLIEKEFKQIMRNPFLPRLILMMPLLIMFVYPWAASQEVKDVKLSIVDHDHSTYSERLIQKILSSDYFLLTDVSASNEEALKSIESNHSDIILEIEDEFEKNLVTGYEAHVMISANAVNGVRAGLGSSYLGAILNDFAMDIRDENGGQVTAFNPPVINIVTQNRFNPYLDYKIFMIPALMVILLTLICGFMPAFNIVGEKEAGTIEQMNVTPVSKFNFILAKLIPYWIIGFIIITICFIIAALMYGLSPAGSIGTIYLFAGIYILVVSGLGLLVSNSSNTMQQAMFVIYFFIMIFLLMIGMFTPISSMPDWAQYITIINPLKYFIEVMRMVYLKGSVFADLLPQAIALISFAIVVNICAILSYRKSS